MDAETLMKRCENALRTGQTENLFPVLAARTLQQIAAERAENRRQWAQLSVSAAWQMAAKNLADAVQPVVDAWQRIREAMLPAIESITKMVESTQADYTLVPFPQTARDRERNLANLRSTLKAAQAANQIHLPRPNIRSNP